MSSEIPNSSIPNFCRSRRGSVIDSNIVTISPCSSVDINQCQNVISESATPTNPEKNIEIVLLKIREQLQSLGGRSVLKLYTMLNLERLLRETTTTTTNNTEGGESNANMINDTTTNENTEENNSPGSVHVPSSNNMTSSNNNSGSNTNNKVISFEASRTANSSFVGVVSSCASSLGISPVGQSKTPSMASKIFANDLFPDQPPIRRGSMITPQKVNNDFNSYYKINERRYSHSRPRTNSLCIDNNIHKKANTVYTSNNIQVDGSKSIEISPINDKEVKNSKIITDENSTTNTINGGTPKNDLYNDNISVTYDELVDGCVRVGLVLTTQEYETLFKYTKSKNSMVGIHRLILRIGGGLNIKRLELVRNTFKMLINNEITTPGNAFILLKDAKAKFSPNEHPRVKSGEITPEQVLYRFLYFFESDRPDGVIELIEWEYYYATISAEISQDSFFEKQMVQCWPGLQAYYKYMITPRLNNKRRREIAEQLNVMNYVTNNYRVFRDLLDIAFIECNQDGMHHLEKNELYEILRHFYLLIHQPFDESIFDELWVRIYKDLEEVITITDYEEQLYNAIKKEINYMEYEIFVHVANENNSNN